MKHLKGVVVPLVTPFDWQGRVDIVSLKSLTNYVLDGGVQAIYPCGTNGEMFMLNTDERKLVAETVIKECNQRVPVFVQVGAQTLMDTLELAKHAVNCGADGIGVVTPPFFVLSDEELFTYYKNISQELPRDFPIYLYGIPQNAVNDISVKLAKQIASSCPNVVGIKYSYSDVSKIEQFLTINQGTFSVLVGPDELFQAVVQIGGDGVVSGNAQVFCEIFVSIWKALESGNHQLATVLQRKANEVILTMRENNGIAACKYILYRNGVISTPNLRSPLATLTEQQGQILVQKISDLL